jgi:3-demethoxyubiquinol 3-hydroxylase
VDIGLIELLWKVFGTVDEGPPTENVERRFPFRSPVNNPEFAVRFSLPFKSATRTRVWHLCSGMASRTIPRRFAFLHVRRNSTSPLNGLQTPMSSKDSNALSSMLRVDHAGELAAFQIYSGQLFILSRTHPELVPLIQEMQDQESHHLNTFNNLLASHRVRPTVMSPIWKIAGWTLGAVTAAMGKEAAMACTSAVETVIGEHYDDQIRGLLELEKKYPEGGELSKLTETVSEFRDDELEHRDIAIEKDAEKAAGYPALEAVIGGGCRAAIWISEKI